MKRTHKILIASVLTLGLSYFAYQRYHEYRCNRYVGVLITLVPDEDFNEEFGCRMERADELWKEYNDHIRQ